MGQTVNLLTYVFGGSNPSSPTKNAEVAQLIEHQPSKLRVASLSLVFRSNVKSDYVFSHNRFLFTYSVSNMIHSLSYRPEAISAVSYTHLTLPTTSRV